MLMFRLLVILTLTASSIFPSSLRAIATTVTSIGCHPPYIAGKQYAVGDWVTVASSSIIAADATKTMNNRYIPCSPPGIDDCPASGYIISDGGISSSSSSSTATTTATDSHDEQRYNNYQCHSSDIQCSDEKYAPGTMFSDVAWTMMGTEPCSATVSVSYILTCIHASRHHPTEDRK